MKNSIIGIVQICAGWLGLFCGAVLGAVLDFYLYGGLGAILAYAMLIGAVIGVGYTALSLQAISRQNLSP
jgi:hypothetical protein